MEKLKIWSVRMGGRSRKSASGIENASCCLRPALTVICPGMSAQRFEELLVNSYLTSKNSLPFALVARALMEGASEKRGSLSIK